MKQLGCTSWDVVKHLLVLFQESPVWRYRALAADLLIVLGRCLLVGERNRGEQGEICLEVQSSRC